MVDRRLPVVTHQAAVVVLRRARRGHPFCPLDGQLLAPCVLAYVHKLAPLDRQLCDVDALKHLALVTVDSQLALRGIARLSLASVTIEKYLLLHDSFFGQPLLLRRFEPVLLLKRLRRNVHPIDTFGGCLGEVGRF